MRKGLLIVIDGPDGCGKTTQIGLLKKRLESEGREILTTREPGGTIISEKIRDILLDNDNHNMSSQCEALLYAAARAQLISEIIIPALNEGKIIVCDRFIHSSLVYQGIGRNLGIDNIATINKFAVAELQPDLTILIDIDYEEGLRRKKNQKKLDRLENAEDEFHRKVAEGYKYVHEMYSDVKILNGENTVENISDEIFRLVKKALCEERL